MIEGIEEFYQRITQSMIDAIPEAWSSATFEAIFFDNHSIYEAEYVRTADRIAYSFQPASGGSKAFRELRKRFLEAGKKPWGRARFELLPDGKFQVRWGYDNCDENGFTLFDADQEFQRREANRKRLTRRS